MRISRFVEPLLTTIERNSNRIPIEPKKFHYEPKNIPFCYLFIQCPSQNGSKIHFLHKIPGKFNIFLLRPNSSLNWPMLSKGDPKILLLNEINQKTWMF